MRRLFRAVLSALRKNIGAGILVFVPVAFTVWLVTVVWMWLDSPVRVRLRVDSGRFRLAAGIREIATDPEVGEDGGTSGPIEWVGATSEINGAPQGVLVEAMPGK